jgi:hypothetical protein
MATIPTYVLAAGPQSRAQLYELLGGESDQVVMLSNWVEGYRFSTYEESPDSAREHFSDDARVWISCEGKPSTNQISKIDTSGDLGWTTIDLREKPDCASGPALMSNHEFPKPKWSAEAPSDEESRAIAERTRASERAKVTKIVNSKKEVFYLVFDPTISSIYELGGYRFLDRALKQISVFEGAPLIPLIDLDGDEVPEFFFPSSDGLDAWLYQLFPRLNTESSLHDKALQPEPPPLPNHEDPLDQTRRSPIEVNTGKRSDPSNPNNGSTTPTITSPTPITAARKTTALATRRRMTEAGMVHTAMEPMTNPKHPSTNGNKPTISTRYSPFRISDRPSRRCGRARTPTRRSAATPSR